jgi:FkbM family methyltransferase
MLQALGKLNRASFWRKEVAACGGRFRATTGDRLLYLWLHRLGLLGSNQSVVENQLRPGMAAADIGANVGVYTYLLSRCVGDTGTVYSFEPDPELFTSLESNCRRNNIKNTKLYNVALGSRDDTMRLERSWFNSGDNRVAAGPSRRAMTQAFVPVRPLDDVLEGRRLDFIKIDVQGSEYEVFKGMRRTLAHSSSVRIYFEFWPAGLRRAGCEPVELLAFLEQLGLGLYRIEGKRLTPFARNRLRSALKGRQWTNLMAIR